MHIYKKIAIGIILTGIIFSTSSLILPKKAKAAVPVFETALLKEGPLDFAAYTLAKQVWRGLMRDVIGWIRTGDIDGGPLFIQNFLDFFTELRQDATSIFISGFLDPAVQATIPSSFRDTITQNIINTVKIPTAFIPSTLVNILPNEDSFFRDYKVGGLIGLYHIVTMPQNQAAGRIILALEDEARYAAQRFLEGQTETLSSDGAKGYADCGIWLPNPAGKDVCVKRNIKTPGANVQDVLARIFEGDFNALELADEFNEIIAALINRLIFSVLDFDLSDASIDPFAGTTRTPTPTTTTPPPPGGTPPPQGGTCNNNNVCESGENSTSCTTDCAGGYCGDGVCNASETTLSCIQDCTTQPGGQYGTITLRNTCTTLGPANIVTIATNVQAPTDGFTILYCNNGPVCTPTIFVCTIFSSNASCLHENIIPGVTYRYTATFTTSAPFQPAIVGGYGTIVGQSCP